MEMNAPVYSWPTVATGNSRIRQAGRREFIYTVKVCELITHVKRFAGTHQLMRDFGLIADLLAPRIGCFHFSFPQVSIIQPAKAFGIPKLYHYEPLVEKYLAQLLMEQRSIAQIQGHLTTRVSLLELSGVLPSRLVGVLFKYGPTDRTHGRGPETRA